MMTFKEFYLRSSKGDKAPPRASRRFKTHKMQNEILDRIKKLKAAKGRSGSTNKRSRCEPACPKLTANRTYGGRRGTDAD